MSHCYRISEKAIIAFHAVYYSSVCICEHSLTLHAERSNQLQLTDAQTIFLIHLLLLILIDHLMLLIVFREVNFDGNVTANAMYGFLAQQSIVNFPPFIPINLYTVNKRKEGTQKATNIKIKMAGIHIFKTYFKSLS